MSDKIIVESPEGVKAIIKNDNIPILEISTRTIMNPTFNVVILSGNYSSETSYPKVAFNIQQVIKAVKKEIKKI